VVEHDPTAPSQGRGRSLYKNPGARADLIWALTNDQVAGILTNMGGIKLNFFGVIRKVLAEVGQRTCPWSRTSILGIRVQWGSSPTAASLASIQRRIASPSPSQLQRDMPADDPHAPIHRHTVLDPPRPP
jgi:hypothetical protein